jgi:microcystin-dependent protein
MEMEMGAPYLGEVRSFAFNYDPTDWLSCEGQLLPIRDYQALFSLLGTTYGGDGVSVFGLPKIPPLETAESGVGLSWRICIADGIYPPRS